MVEISDKASQEFINRINDINVRFKNEKNFMDFCEIIGTCDLESLETTDFYDWLVKTLSKYLDCDPYFTTNSLYRARKIENEEDIGLERHGINISQKIGYNSQNSKEPPLRIAQDGRCNLTGSTYLYLSEDEYTALVETKPNIMEFISLARFKITKPLKILDLTKIKENNFESKYYPMKIYNAFRALPSDKSVYMVCQYISDLIRKFGYDGIKFESSLTTSYNLTIFNCSPDKIQFVDSRIVRAAQLWYSFVDLKNKTIINKNFRDDINDDTFKQANNELSALKRQFCKSKKKNVINS